MVSILRIGKWAAARRVNTDRTASTEATFTTRCPVCATPSNPQ